MDEHNMRITRLGIRPCTRTASVLAASNKRQNRLLSSQLHLKFRPGMVQTSRRHLIRPLTPAAARIERKERGPVKWRASEDNTGKQNRGIQHAKTLQLLARGPAKTIATHSKKEKPKECSTFVQNTVLEAADRSRVFANQQAHR